MVEPPPMDVDDAEVLELEALGSRVDAPDSGSPVGVNPSVGKYFFAQPVPALSWLGLSVSVPLRSRFRRLLSLASGATLGCLRDDQSGSSVVEDLSQFKPLLSAVDGAVSAGEILFIMGGSGSGKSMLLDALADRLRLSVRGQVHLFGQLKGTRSFNGLARYVEQDDQMYESLTTRETIEYAAAFAGVPSAELPGVVDEALNVLGLESVANLRVGGRFFRGLSGGQRRRLSVGCQLVSKPVLLLCDEVMSGLDSHAAMQVMRHLREVADGGSAVVCSVHTPTAAMFDLSDNLCLLSRGRVAYFGPSSEVESYFQRMGYTLPPRVSVAEWVISLINPDFSSSTAAVAEEVCDAWPGSAMRVRLLSRIAGRDVSALWDTAVRASMVSGSNVDPVEELDVATAPDRASVAELRQGCACSLWKQLWLLTKRSLVDALRNPGVMWLRFSVHLGLAILIGLAWLRRPELTAADLFDRLGLLFFVQAFFVQTSLSVVPVYLDERVICERERANRQYSLLAYMVAHLVVESTVVLLLAVTSGTVIFFMCGLNPHLDRYFFFIGIQWLSLMVTESLMLLIAAMSPVMLIGLAFASFVLSLMTIVQGFVIRMENLGPLRMVRWISLHGYALAAIFANEFSGRTFAASPNTWPPYPVDVDGDAFYATFEFPTHHRSIAAVALLGMLVFYRLAAFLWIWSFHNGKK